MLQKNLEAFSSRYTKLNLSESDTVNLDFTIENSRSGVPTAVLEGSYLHSRHNPVREASKLSRQISKADLIILGGFGLGYLCEELCVLHPDTIIVVTEPSKELLYMAFTSRNLESIILNQNIYFLVDEDPDLINNFLIPQRIKKIEYIPLLPRTNKKKEYFDSLEYTINTYLERMEINRRTLIKFGKLWVKNQTKNLPYMGYKIDLASIFNKFNDIPGIIVSAGPSMELIIPYLKVLKERFLILSVDTALKSLIEEGIEPDFVMSIDSQYWNSLHLTGVKTKKSILIADSSVPPSIIQGFGNRVYFTQSSFPMGKYFESFREPFPKIASGGSVSTNLWDFAHKLGLSEVFFIGQDLGFPDNITHYKNSYFEKNMLIKSDRSNPVESQSFKYIYSGYPFFVKSNSNNLILSDKRMKIYIKWFNERLQYDSYKNSYNLSPDGCKLEGMEFRNITKLQEYPISRDKIELILAALSKYDENCYLPKILEASYSFKNDLEQIKSLSDKAVKLSTSIEYLFNENKDINKDLERLNAIDDQIIKANQKETLSFIIEPFISEIAESEEKNPFQALKKSQLIYEKLLSTSILHLKYLNHSIKKITNILK